MFKLDVFLLHLPCDNSAILDYIIEFQSTYGVHSEKLQFVKGICLLRTDNGAYTLDVLKFYHIPVLRFYNYKFSR
jgi:hypothetical protein